MSVSFVSTRQRFWAVVTSLLACDRWLQAVNFGDRPGRSAQPADPWFAGGLAVAQACTSTPLPPADRWGQYFQTQAQGQPGALLLAALPVLLVNADGYGHRRRAMQLWAESLGLQVPDQIALDQGFVIICDSIICNSLSQNQSQGSHSLEPWHLEQRHGRPTSNPPSGYGLAQVLIQQSQQQFTLALELADRMGWSTAMIGLVGGLVAWQTGTVPLRLSYPMGSQALAWGASYPDLETLAQTLYAAWAAGHGQALGQGLAPPPIEA